MSRDEDQSLSERVAQLARMLSATERLAPEVQRARRQFFGESEVHAVDRAAEHRFVEWFLLERESEGLGAVPATIAPYDALARELEGSVASAWLVEGTDPAVTVRDVQDDAIYELAVDSGAFAAHDVIVGRLYPGAGERWLVSPAAPVMRSAAALADAVRQDLTRLGLDRRLQQIELEHLLLHGQHGRAFESSASAQLELAPPAPLEHLEADLEKLLTAAGNRHSATAISNQLARAERPGQLVGPLLDQLAFDTDVDLDNARRLLLEIWNAHHASDVPSTEAPARTDEPSGGPPGETLGERLVRTLDEGLEQRKNVEELFAELERMAGIDGDEDDDDDESSEGDPRRTTTAADDEDADPGDLAPLVTEFLWESGRGEQSKGPLTLWVELQRNAPLPRTDFETIAANDLMRLFLHVFLGAPPSQRAAAVRTAFAELRAFYEWVAASHEVDRQSVLSECRGALLDHLDRLQAAGELLTTSVPHEQTPGLLQVEDVGKDGFGARDDDGEHYWLRADADAVANLQVGDLVLGALADADADAGAPQQRLVGLVVVMPIDARALIE